MKKLALIATSTILTVLATGCAVSPNGPARNGAAHGSVSMIHNYFYKTAPGWQYVYQNVKRPWGVPPPDILAGTVMGPNDTVNTLGYAGSNTPFGDSLFMIEHVYRVNSSYATPNEMTINYVAGGFCDGPVDNMSTCYKKPRPVSTDTILAGMVGRVRTIADDFGSFGSYTWKHDTIYFAFSGDNTFIWELVSGVWTKSRRVFQANPNQNDTWNYDIINTPNPVVSYRLENEDTSFSLFYTTYNNCVKISVHNSEIGDNFNHSEKYYANGYGQIYQRDWWKVTNYGTVFTNKEFVRTLLSVTHP